MLRLRRDMYSRTLGRLWFKDYGLTLHLGINPVSITDGEIRTVTVMRMSMIIDQRALPVGRRGPLCYVVPQ